MNAGSKPWIKRKRRWTRPKRDHVKKAAAIQAEVETLEKRLRTEDARWEKEKERLEAALRRARG